MARGAWLALGSLLAACRAPAPEPLVRAVEPVVAAASEADATEKDDAREEAPPAVDVDVEAPEESVASRPPSACNEQAPQVALERSSYALDLKAPPEERARRRELHQKAIEYRTRHYGYVEGFGDKAWNAKEPKELTASARFFGIPVRMNRRVLAALACVEADIEATCAATPYAPHKLDTLRYRNTFHDNEVSNHVYGIAIDVDWDTNPCCGCVAPLSNDKRCQTPGSAYERTNLPRCWVDAFERYGFYWLGHDALEDTMHFEFLGDPDKIEKRAGSSPASAPSAIVAR